MKSYLPTRWSNRPFSSPHNNDQYLRKTWTDTWNQQRVSIIHRTNIYHHKMAIIFWSGRCWPVHWTNFKQHLCAKIDKTSKRLLTSFSWETLRDEIYQKKILQSNLIQTGVTVKIQTGHCSTNELSPKLYLIAHLRKRSSHWCTYVTKGLRSGSCK